MGVGPTSETVVIFPFPEYCVVTVFSHHLHNGSKLKTRSTFSFNGNIVFEGANSRTLGAAGGAFLIKGKTELLYSIHVLKNAVNQSQNHYYFFQLLQENLRLCDGFVKKTYFKSKYIGNVSFSDSVKTL